MTECQGCGAWNERSRERCVLCATPLAATDEWEATAELPPLPPLPDGGLRDSMPSWLREAPTEDGGRRTEDGGTSAGEQASRQAGERAVVASQGPPTPDLRLPTSDPLGPRADPRTFLSDDDFPPWLRELAAREARNPAIVAASHFAPHSWPEWPVAPPENPRPSVAVATAASEERRPRAVWETLLLVILFLSVVAAALWALVSNGVFGPRL